MTTEAQAKCADAGIRLALEHYSYKKATPIIWPSVNLKGLVRPEDFKVPHSEVAMHVGAAGKDIIAFTLVGSSAALIVYDNGAGGCGFSFGLEDEWFSKPLLEETKRMWEKRGPD